MSELVTPQPGDIWSHRYRIRRVKVLRIWNSGRVQVKGVELAGTQWKYAPGTCSRSVDGASFPKWFRLLARPAA